MLINQLSIAENTFGLRAFVGIALDATRGENGRFRFLLSESKDHR